MLVSHVLLLPSCTYLKVRVAPHRGPLIDVCEAAGSISAPYIHIVQYFKVLYCSARLLLQDKKIK